MASPCSSSSLWKFDVFLSFRGADTRRTFVGFLYKELDRQAIKTFKDDEELERGEYISTALLQAIEESKFAVVVMSENYASSGWCLEELAKIMECHEKGTLKAIPVFYKVEPTHVRRQTEKFAEYMRKHEGREDREKVRRWRDALTKLAEISGESSENWKDDSKLVDKIVNDISYRLISAAPSDFSDLVGMDVRARAVYELLGLESKNEVRMIGVWGMGGIGKTTLACYVYENIKRHFQAHCFLENVKEICGDHNQSRLQEELLSKFLGRDLTITSSNEGFNIIKAILGHQQILLVLDDVETIAQLSAVAKKPIPFGPGSRVIVTTRDKRLLDVYGATHVYKVECLENSEALTLFCKHAFEQDYPLSGFERLSDRAIKLAGGLPLALKVFGSHLYGETEEDWEVVSDKLQRSPDKDVMKILKVSYDGLDDESKSIFLWVACFFNGKHIDRVAGLLDDNGGRDARHEIKVLVRRSLIAISNGGDVTIHDLIQQMGRELVCQQSPHEPGKRKLLWKPDEIHDVLAYNEGTRAIEGISFNPNEEDELIIHNEAFESMRRLKYFKIYNRRSPKGIKVFLTPSVRLSSLKLRYLGWYGYPLETLQFRPQFLVELDLRYSKLEKLWEGSPCLGNLKKIKLTASVNLKELPNLSKAPNLEEIVARYCESLIEIPSSVCSLSKLTLLNLEGCHQLERIPNNMDMKSLEILELYACHNLKVFPQFSRGIQRVFLSGGRQRELSESIGYLSHLQRLVISDFQLLENLPDSIGDLISLRGLDLNNCPRLRRIPETIWKLKSLVDFSVSDGRSITEFPHLPENVNEVVFAKTAIEEIPSCIGDLCYLEKLHISETGRLKCLPASVYKLKGLLELRLCGMSGLEIFSAEICETTSCFGELNSEEKSIRMPPLSIFENLMSLEISRAEKSDGVPFHCPPLSSFPLLEQLRLTYLNMLEIPGDLGLLTDLELLDLSGNDFQKIPASIKQLTKLDSLCINNCKNMRSLSELPARIAKLSAHGCIALETTENMLTQSLKCLRLSNCFKLKGDQRISSEHVTSKASYAEFTCLSGGEVPSSFKYQSTGHFLKVSLPRDQNSGVYVGFAACIVVAFEDYSCFQGLTIEWTCKCLKRNSSEIVWRGGIDLWSILDYSTIDIKFQSDHLFLFKGSLEQAYDMEADLNVVGFEFCFKMREGYYSEELDEESFPQLEIKECGVSLYINPADEQSEIKLSASEPTLESTREHRVPNRPSEVENNGNRKRSYGPTDNETIMDSQPQEQELSSKKGKFIELL